MIASSSALTTLRESSIRLFACGAALAVAGFILVFIHPSWWPLSVITLMALPLLFGLAMRDRAASSMGVILQADARVGRQLERLEGAGYLAWHAVECGRELIDHVVLGPTGVFAIQENEEPGRFELGADGWLRRDRKDAGEMVWEATKRAMILKIRLRESGLRVPVQGVMALTHGKLPKGPIDMGKVTFLEAEDLVSFVRSRRSALTIEQVERAASVILNEDALPQHQPGPRS